MTTPMKKMFDAAFVLSSYWCKLCKQYHNATSKIGIRHMAANPIPPWPRKEMETR